MKEVGLALQLAEAKNCITFKACVSAYGMRDNRTNEAYTSWMNSLNNLLIANYPLLSPADYVVFDELIDHYEKMLTLVTKGETMVSAEKIKLKEAYNYLLLTKLDLNLMEDQTPEIVREIKCKWLAICEIMEELNIPPIKIKEYESYPFLVQHMKDLNIKFHEGGLICSAT